MRINTNIDPVSLPQICLFLSVSLRRTCEHLFVRQAANGNE